MKSGFSAADAGRLGRTVSSMVTSLGGQAVMIVSGVLVARLLGVEQRGQLAMIALVPAALAYVASFGVPMAVAYFVARDAIQLPAMRRIAIRIGFVQALLIAPVCAIAIALLPPTYHEDLVPLIVVALLAPAFIFHAIGLGVLQGAQAFRAYNLQRVLPLVFYAAGLLLLYIVGRASLNGVLAIMLGSQWVATTACLLQARGRGASGFGGEHPAAEHGPSDARALLRFGGKMFVASLSPVETFRADQLIVGVSLSSYDLGLYVVALAVSLIPRLVAQSVGMVAYPAIAALRPSGTRVALAWRYVAVTAALVCLVVLLLELTVSPIIRFFFGTAFAAAVPVARILLLAVGLMGVRRIVSDCCRGMGHPGYESVAEAVSLPALAVGAWILIPIGGVVGVAFALFLAYLVGVVAIGSLFLRVSLSELSAVTAAAAS